MDEFKYGDLIIDRMYRWSKRYGCVYRFRQGSVPGIHHYGYGGRCFKNPPHRYEESNRYLADEDDHQVLTPLQIYHIEKYRWVPDPWDDIPRRFYGHTWKRHRKTQYK